MRTAFLALALPVSLLLVGGLAACEGDKTSSGPGLDASTGTFDSGPGPTPDGSTGADAEGGTPGVCTEANYVNGKIAVPPNGRMNHHIQNVIDAQIVTPTGTIPCEAKFNAAGGVAIGAGMSGEYDIQCNDVNEDQYFGFHVHGLGKLGPATTQYTIGKAAAVGGVLNDQVDLTWESGSRCGAKAATLREWAGEPSIPGRAVFIVDELTGTDVKFHISPTDMKVTSRNVEGKGTFTLDVAVISAAPLTIVGM